MTLTAELLAETDELDANERHHFAELLKTVAGLPGRSALDRALRRDLLAVASELVADIDHAE